MGSLFKIFFTSCLIGVGFVGVGLTIDLRMDNASKEYLQVLYFVMMLVLSVLENIATLTSKIGQSPNGANLFIFSVSQLNIATGMFGFIAIKGITSSPFAIACIILFAIGVFCIIKTTFLSHRSKA